MVAGAIEGGGGGGGYGVMVISSMAAQNLMTTAAIDGGGHGKGVTMNSSTKPSKCEDWKGCRS